MSDIIPGDRGDGGDAPGFRRRAAIVAALIVSLGCAAALLFVVGGNDSGDRQPADAAAARRDSASESLGRAFIGGENQDDVSLATTTTSRAATPTTRVSVTSRELAAATRVAEQFLVAAQERDCEGILVLFSAQSLAFIESVEDDGKSGRDAFCHSVATEEIPPMRLHSPARPAPGGAIVELESEGEVEPIALVLESGAWKIDLLGTAEVATQEDAASEKQSELRNALTAEKVVYTDEQRYTDDVVKLEEIEPSLRWQRGVAASDGDRSVVYVAVADHGQVVCLSGVDRNGTRYMVKDFAGDVTYAKGEATPRHCDSLPLGDTW